MGASRELLKRLGWTVSPERQTLVEALLVGRSVAEAVSLVEGARIVAYDPPRAKASSHYKLTPARVRRVCKDPQAARVARGAKPGSACLILCDSWRGERFRFGLRVYETGKVSYVAIVGRDPGRRQQILGDAESLAFKTARDRALALGEEEVQAHHTGIRRGKTLWDLFVLLIEESKKKGRKSTPVRLRCFIRNIFGYSREDYLRIKGLSFEQAYRYLRRRRPEPGYFPIDAKVSSITPQQVTRWYERPARRFSALEAYDFLRLAFNLAERESWRQPRTNPCTDPRATIEKPRKLSQPKRISAAEYRNLGQAIERLLSTRRMSMEQLAPILLKLFTGRRTTEICHLKKVHCREVDSRHFVAVRLTKGRRVSNALQEIPVNEAAWRIVQYMLARNEGSEFMFPSPKDPHRPVAGLDGRWRKIVEEAGLEGLRLKDFRSEYVSLGENYAQPQVMAKLAGHGADVAEKHYYRASDQAQLDATTAIGETLTGLLGVHPASYT